MIRRPSFPCFAALAAAFALLAAPAQAELIAITGGKVVTNTPAGVIENGVVVLRDGKIAAVGGADLAIPAGAERVDAAGRWVTPGLFAAISRVGLAEAGLEEANNDDAVKETPVAAAADASYAFNPDAVAIAVTRLEGVTRQAILPASGPGPIEGYGALTSLTGAADSLTRPRAFAYIVAGEAGAARAGQSRMTFWPYLDAAVADAKAYPARYQGVEIGAVLRRAEAEAFAPAAKGQIPILMRVERAADIRAAIAFQRRHGLRLTLVGAAEGWQVAGDLAAAKIPVIVDPFQNLPAAFEAMTARMDNAALLAAAGVEVAIAQHPSEDIAYNPRLIPQLAGNAAAHGLPWEKAFAAITVAPARIFGMADVGRLSPGARGDVVVWSGDPLELMSAPTAVYIDGQAQPLESRQTRLRDRYKTLDRAGEEPFQYR